MTATVAVPCPECGLNVPLTAHLRTSTTDGRNVTVSLDTVDMQPMKSHYSEAHADAQA